MRDVIRKDRRLGVRAVAEEVNLDRKSVRRILREELNLRMVCAKMVPKLLSDEQKERRKELCLYLLQRIENEPDLFNSITTCDETWSIYVRSRNQATSNAVEVNIISKTKKSTHESFEVQGHVDCFL